MALTQQQVVRRAVDLMAEVGLEALTLRRLATELGVSAPTLYWHVRNKRQLLDLMAEALVERAGRSTAPAPGQPWWDWLAEEARLMWRALTSHRDAALVVAGNRPTDTALPGIEQVMASLVTVGFPPAEALRMILSISNYVIGCAVERQAEAARDPEPEPTTPPWPAPGRRPSYWPTRPSIRSRRKSAWPLWRAYSSIMCTSTSR